MYIYSKLPRASLPCKGQKTYAYYVQCIFTAYKISLFHPRAFTLTLNFHSYAYACVCVASTLSLSLSFTFGVHAYVRIAERFFTYIFVQRKALNVYLRYRDDASRPSLWFFIYSPSLTLFFFFISSHDAKRSVFYVCYVHSCLIYVRIRLFLCDCLCALYDDGYVCSFSLSLSLSLTVYLAGRERSNSAYVTIRQTMITKKRERSLYNLA